MFNRVAAMMFILGIYICGKTVLKKKGKQKKKNIYIYITELLDPGHIQPVTPGAAYGPSALGTLPPADDPAPARAFGIGHSAPSSGGEPFDFKMDTLSYFGMPRETLEIH